MKQNKIKNFLVSSMTGKIIKLPVSEIHKLPDLEQVFKMDPEVRDRIRDDIKKNGFSKAHPVHVFFWQEKWCLVDGHTRFAASKDAGLTHIWCEVHQFTSVDDAVLFSMKEQFNRRNETDAELFKRYELMLADESAGSKVNVEELSKALKKSKRHIFKIQFVKKNGSRKQLNDIRNGKSSVNKVFNEIKEKESSEKEQSVQQKKKNVQDFPKVIPDQELFIRGIQYALIEIAKGKTIKEVFEEKDLSKIDVATLRFSKSQLEMLK